MQSDTRIHSFIFNNHSSEDLAWIFISTCKNEGKML